MMEGRTRERTRERCALKAWAEREETRSTEKKGGKARKGQSHDVYVELDAR